MSIRGIRRRLKWPPDWRAMRSLLTKGDRELKIAACAAAVVVGFSLVSPAAIYVDWKDTHRKVEYTRYDAKLPEPMIGLALGAHNLEGYLNETWNQYSRNPAAYRWVAAEFHWFIKENEYNERKLANEGGSDWTRPYLGIFEKSLARAEERLYTFSGPMASTKRAGEVVDGAWTHSQYNNTHQQPYSCGTSEAPRTCWMTVCDSTDHNFRLDKAKLSTGLVAAMDGWRSFPEVPQEKLGLFKIETKTGEQGPWMHSPFVARYRLFLRDIELAAGGASEKNMLPRVVGYQEKFHTNTPGCGSPRKYPDGYQEKERIVGHINEALAGYLQIQSGIATLKTVSSGIQQAIKEIEADNGESGMRNMADLAWVIHNQNKGDSKRSYGTVKWLIRLAWLLIVGGATAGFLALCDKYRHTRFLRRIHERYD